MFIHTHGIDAVNAGEKDTMHVRDVHNSGARLQRHLSPLTPRRMNENLLTARQFSKTAVKAWVARICTTGFWLNTIPLFVASVGSRKL
jgi:hypothetical protein